jgi:sec-independent protein translocase protein TatC
VQLIPFLVEHPLLGVAFALTLVVYVGNLVALSYWARAEARARNGSVLWTFIYLFTGFGLVHYVWVRYVRHDWEPRTEPADRRERLATAYSLAGLLSFVVGAFVTPPDPMTQVMALPPLFVVSFLISSLLVTQGAVGGSGEAAV